LVESSIRLYINQTHNTIGTNTIGEIPQGLGLT